MTKILSKPPQLIILDKTEQVNQAIEYLKDKEYVAFDSETTGVHKGAQVVGISFCASETEAYYLILYSWNVDKLVPTVDSDKIKELIRVLLDKSLIMHNGTFDCAMIDNNFKISLIDSLHTDTMILAHLLDENRKIGLKELAKHYFGEGETQEQKEMSESVIANGGIYTKTQKEMYKADPYILGKYGAKDAWLTYKLFYTLVPELYDQKLDTFFYEEESMPLLKGPTYQLNTMGLKVDTNSLTVLHKTLVAECEEHKAFIHKEIDVRIKQKYPGDKKKNTFNIGSSTQLSWLLFSEYQLTFLALTDEGKAVSKFISGRIPYSVRDKNDFISKCSQLAGTAYTAEVKTLTKTIRAKKIKEPWSYLKCDKTVLKKYADKYKWIAQLLDYNRKRKLLSTYVEGLEERIQYGIIQPSFLQHGTTAGRYASRNPNFQNLPRDDKRVKGCIVSRPGKVFVGADYSQLEPRIFAYFSGDERLLKAFKGQDDFYSVIGMGVYDKIDCVPRKEGSEDAFGVKYKRLRDLSKVIALASTYGATAAQLAPTTGKSIDDTQEDINNYFERFPKVKQFQLDSHTAVKKDGAVYNLFGRPRRIPEAKQIPQNIPHDKLPYIARTLLNLGVNHRIQSTGASIVNRASIRFYENCKKANINAYLVLQVHDSLIAECDEKDAEDVSILLEDAMVSTTILNGIDLEAIPKIGKNLAEV